MKPYLKWLGGKARLAPRISEEMSGPSKSLYFEPFCGALGVFLYRHERGEIQGRAILSDANERLIETHRAVRLHLDDVLEELEGFEWGENYANSYVKNKVAFNEEKPGSIRQAALFIWINKACFNGLYRVNRRGEFNVAVGRCKRPSRLSEAEFRKISEALACASLVHSDFRGADLQTSWRCADQIYVDPPYAPLNATWKFTGYTKEGFHHRCQMELAIAASYAADRGARIVASNHDVEAMTSMYAQLGFSIHSIQAKRSIGASSSSRKKVGEMLAVR